MKDSKRIDKALDFIGQHLDEVLDLDALCQTVHLSKYHFHRLFTSQVGLSLKAYIRWLRLKRAAYQLVMHKTERLSISLWRRGLNPMNHLVGHLNAFPINLRVFSEVMRIGTLGGNPLFRCAPEGR